MTTPQFAPSSAVPALPGRRDADDYQALLQFLYLAPVGLVQTDTAGAIVMLNPLSSRLLMPLAPSGELSNLFTVLEGIAPDLRDRVASFGKPYGYICDAMQLVVSADSVEKLQPQTLSISLLKLDDSRLMAVLADVSEQVRRERLLRQNEAGLNDIRDYALVGLDSSGNIEDWNAGIGRVAGFSREQVVGKSWSIFHPEDHATPERVRDLLRDADDNGWRLDAGWRVRADGSRFWGSTLISPLTDRSCLTAQAADDDGKPSLAGYSLVIRDIDDQRKASESHRKTHSCDQLTGIANRRAFFEASELELARARRSSRQLSLMVIVADPFEDVTDRHGRAAGDTVLQHLAGVLTDTFGTVDGVARIGGEEFAVLLPATDLDAALSGAERLRKAVRAKALVVAGQPLHYTISAGVATASGASTTLDDLIERAERALSQAKAAGRNRVAWSVPA